MLLCWFNLSLSTLLTVSVCTRICPNNKPKFVSDSTDLCVYAVYVHMSRCMCSRCYLVGPYKHIALEMKHQAHTLVRAFPHGCSMHTCTHWSSFTGRAKQPVPQTYSNCANANSAVGSF